MRAVVSWTLLLLLTLWGTPQAGERPFGGIGAQVVPTASGELVVLRVVAESPAKGSLQEGDLIVAVDGFTLTGSDFSEVVPKRLWGEPGSSVRLIFKRPGVAGTREVTLQRIAMQPGGAQSPAVKMLVPGDVREGKKP